MPQYRLRLPSAILRILQQRAGDALQPGLRRLAELWADGTIDPLADDPIASAIARRGARALNQSRTHAERSAAARKAVSARWAKRATAD